MLKMVSSLSEGKKIRREGKKKRRKKEILIKTLTEIPTKVKKYTQQKLNKIKNLYHSFSNVVNYIQSQF